MPIVDNKSNTNVVVLMNVKAVTDSVVNSDGLDTAEYDMGITFLPVVVTADGGSDVVLTAIQESDDDGNTDPYTDVPTENLIGSLSDFIGMTPVASDTVIKTLGVIGVKRYVRAVVTFQGSTTDTRFILSVNSGVEVSPGDS